MSLNGNLSEYLISQTFVAWDTETTGIWAPVNKLVEIGAVRFNLSGETETFQALINPERPIPSEVIAIHGITDEMVADAPTVKSVMKDFFEFCRDSVLMAHNAPFDISFVTSECERYEIELPDNPVLDTVEIYRRFFPGLASYSLLSLATHFKMADSQSHRALDDAQMVRLLFLKAAGKFSGVKNREELESVLCAVSMEEIKPDPVELPENYQDLQRAILAKSRIIIQYRRPECESDTRTIRLNNVFQLGSRYYLSAFCEKVGAERTFRLDRIENYQLLD